MDNKEEQVAEAADQVAWHRFAQDSNFTQAARQDARRAAADLDYAMAGGTRIWRQVPE